MSFQTSSVSARTTDTNCLRSSSLVVCGCSICGPCCPGHREIGGVGARLRQLDIGEVRIAAAARRSALQDHARVDAKEEHQAENDENAENADRRRRGPSRRLESRRRRLGREAKPPPSSRRSSTFSLSLSPRQRMASLTSISGRDRPIFDHCACAARWHKVHPWRTELFGARRVEG